MSTRPPSRRVLARTRISANIDLAEVPVELTLQASGTGLVACQVLGCCQRQS